MHATKNGRPLRTPIYYGRCHKEGEGSKVYFVVNKFSPKMNIEGGEDESGSDSSGNSTNGNKNATNSGNKTKAVNGTSNSSSPTNATKATIIAGGAKGADGDDGGDGTAQLPVCANGTSGPGCRPAGSDQS